jgi:hypothetical protein
LFLSFTLNRKVLFMKTPEQHLADLGEIRSLMHRSSRFLSLSGISGVCAGLFALAGAAGAYIYLGNDTFFGLDVFSIRKFPGAKILDYESMANRLRDMDFYTFFLIDAFLVLVCSLTAGYYFTKRKAKRSGASLWDDSVKQLLIHLFVPLAAGGIFALLLLSHDLIALVAPVTLLFYGIALFNAGKYTHNDIRYLGICEIVLGLVGTFYPGSGLLLWAIGFGVLHIVYGIVLYYKYEREGKEG